MPHHSSSCKQQQAQQQQPSQPDSANASVNSAASTVASVGQFSPPVLYMTGGASIANGSGTPPHATAWSPHVIYNGAPPPPTSSEDSADHHRYQHQQPQQHLYPSHHRQQLHHHHRHPRHHHPQSSFDSPQQLAATALLMASKTVSPKELLMSSSSSSSGPLKKRKKLDRGGGSNNNSRSNSPCYVSPMSSTGKFPTAASDASSHASYEDGKDGTANNAHSNNHSNNSIVPDFPILLHKALSADDESSSILQWLPHGKSWRIVRFDALRKTLLPQWFPQLLAGHNKNSSGSLDAFLQQLTLWDFEEVTEGPDVGAYSNLLFRRGVPQLAGEMKPTHSQRKLFANSTDAASAATAEGPRSILRVPSLVSSAGTLETVPSKDGSCKAATADEGKEDCKEEDVRLVQRSATNTNMTSAYTSNRGRRSSVAAGVSYRPDSMPESWAYHYPDPSGNTNNNNTAGHFQTSRSIPYSPVRVRSSRGSAAMGRVAAAHNIVDDGTRWSSFPMSNRGRSVSGRGIGRTTLPTAARRNSVVPALVAVATGTPPASTTATATTARPSAAEAPATSSTTSRMNKRKLPMASSAAASKTTTEPEESEETVATASI